MYEKSNINLIFAVEETAIGRLSSLIKVTSL
jgi:hypothetical protein